LTHEDCGNSVVFRLLIVRKYPDGSEETHPSPPERGKVVTADQQASVFSTKCERDMTRVKGKRGRLRTSQQDGRKRFTRSDKKGKDRKRKVKMGGAS